MLQILDPSFSPDDLDSIFADADLSKDALSRILLEVFGS